MVEAKASIAELRSRLDAETRRVTGGVGVTNTINRQREAEVRAALEAQRAKVLRLKAVRDEGAVLVARRGKRPARLRRRACPAQPDEPRKPDHAEQHLTC